MRRRVLGLACALALGLAAMIAVAVAPALHVKPAGDDESASLAFQPHPGARLPLGANVIDENGRTAALGAYFNTTPVILVLEYLRCRSLCGVTLRNLFESLARLPLEAGRDYQVIALSVDPRDRPSDAKAARDRYARLLAHDGPASGLHFLTAAPAVARSIADKVGFRYRYDRFLDAYIHPTGFVVVAPSGKISHYVEGVAVIPKDLLGAVADAEQDRSLSPLSRIFLLCHVQGAPLGRFTVPVMAALMLANIGAGLTLIVLFATIRKRG